MLFDLLLKNFNCLKLIKRKKVKFVIIFADTISKNRYNLYYKTISDIFKFKFIIYFRFY